MEHFNRIVFTEKKFQESLKFVCIQFGVVNLYEEQINALRAFLIGKHVYFSAHTGYGKSLIFQCLPILIDFYNNTPLYSTMIVISPLKLLMEDQVNTLANYGISAIAVHSDLDENAVKEFIENVKEHNLYSIIYVSPEKILSEAWIEICKILQRTCVGVAIDEAHCIPMW